MRNATSKAVLTTGEVARICHVAPRTVSKWFDSGKLMGYRIPRSRDRRIPLERLLEFMRLHGIPTDEIDGGACRVLVVDGGFPRDLEAEMNSSGKCQVKVAANGFDAGIAALQFRPHSIVLDAASSVEEACAICRNVKDWPELRETKVIAACDRIDRRSRELLAGEGFDGFIQKPYTQAGLISAIDEVANLIG